jgi:predicted kinase
MFQTSKRSRLILFCGLPGSGKTTLAKKLEKELPAVRLCPDEWMAGLRIDLFDESARNNLEVQLWKFAQSLLRQGYSVILENGSWSHEERMDKLQDVAKLNVEVELHYLDIPLEELLHRLEIRNVSGDPNTVPLTREHMERYTKLFQAPDDAGLAQFTQAFVYDASGRRITATDQALIHQIQALSKPRKRPLIIAISGFGGSGKTTLANTLKSQLSGAQIVSIDSFSTHEWRRNADWDNFDRQRFVRDVLAPAHDNKFPLQFVHKPWPGNPEETIAIPKTNCLVVEGCSIFHPDLLRYYDLKIWMDCPLELATERAMWRDRYIHENEQDYYWLNIWMPNERDFLAKYHPDELADIKLSTK